MFVLELEEKWEGGVINDIRVNNRDVTYWQGISVGDDWIMLKTRGFYECTFSLSSVIVFLHMVKHWGHPEYTVYYVHDASCNSKPDSYEQTSISSM